MCHTRPFSSLEHSCSRVKPLLFQPVSPSQGLFFFPLFFLTGSKVFNWCVELAERQREKTVFISLLFLPWWLTWSHSIIRDDVDIMCSRGLSCCHGAQTKTPPALVCSFVRSFFRSCRVSHGGVPSELAGSLTCFQEPVVALLKVLCSAPNNCFPSQSLHLFFFLALSFSVWTAFERICWCYVDGGLGLSLHLRICRYGFETRPIFSGSVLHVSVGEHCRRQQGNHIKSIAPVWQIYFPPVSRPVKVSIKEQSLESLEPIAQKLMVVVFVQVRCLLHVSAFVAVRGNVCLFACLFVYSLR